MQAEQQFSLPITSSLLWRFLGLLISAALILVIVWTFNYLSTGLLSDVLSLIIVVVLGVLVAWFHRFKSTWVFEDGENTTKIVLFENVLGFCIVRVTENSSEILSLRRWRLHDKAIPIPPDAARKVEFRLHSEDLGSRYYLCRLVQ